MPKIKLGKLKTVYKGKIFSIKKRKITLPSGQKAVYEYCARPASVTVLAFNQRNELLMIREWRHGQKGEVWFVPSGRADHPGESIKNAALRELREEGGYSAKTLKLVSKKNSDGTMLWDIYLFAAKNLKNNPLPNDSDEFITPVFVPLKKAVALALSGAIDNNFIAYNIIRFNEMLKRGEFKW